MVNAQWFGSEALELTYKDPSGKVANELLYRYDEPRIDLVESGRPWSFDGDGNLFRLVSEANRIRLAHLLIQYWQSILHSLIRCRTKSQLSMKRCCHDNHYGFCLQTIQAQARRSWQGC